MKHILPTETINKILTYLATKAYAEVSDIINEVKSKALLFTEPAPVTTPVEPVFPVTPVVPVEVVTK